MPGLLQRLRGRRAPASDPVPPPAADVKAEAEAVTVSEQPTEVAAPAADPATQTAETAPVVATVTEDPPAPDESWRRRSGMRRRLRYLRRARELALRDLGGLVFDLDRFERDRPDLVRAKLDALAALDRERRALEAALDDRREEDVLREPGIASCPRCGALHP